jgi:hypothetical protein
MNAENIDIFVDFSLYPELRGQKSSMDVTLTNMYANL